MGGGRGTGGFGGSVVDGGNVVDGGTPTLRGAVGVLDRGVGTRAIVEVFAF